MGEKLNRRQALGRCGAAVLGAALAGLSGIDRLARATAAEMEGGVEPLKTDCGWSLNYCGATGDDWYGCTKTYSPNGCDDERWDCPKANFSGCPNNTIVHCNSDRDVATFRCYNSTGNDPYGCTEREFDCGNAGGGGGFVCGNGQSVPEKYHFECKTSEDLFYCPLRFGCSPRSEFHIC